MASLQAKQSWGYLDLDLYWQINISTERTDHLNSLGSASILISLRVTPAEVLKYWVTAGDLETWRVTWTEPGWGCCQWRKVCWPGQGGTTPSAGRPATQDKTREETNTNQSSSLSLVESFRLLKYFHDVASPAILCHKETARRKQKDPLDLFGL